MNRIKMVSSCNGADVDQNGITKGTKAYQKGHEFDVVPKGVDPSSSQIGEELAKVFCEINVAEACDGDTPRSPKEGAPENKIEDGAPENKRGGRRGRR